ncbi:MAG TPA: hypothetical protein VKY37_00490 [Brumimicrobium sp.]|nr:hypothetical protein [Brumimicrobium sp.]
MKKINYLLQISFVTILMFGFTDVSLAQDPIPKDGFIEHNGGNRPCLYVNLDPETKPLKKAWKSFLKDNYDFKIKGIGFLSNKDLLYKEDVIIEKPHLLDTK